MRRVLHKILCFFGFHDWVADPHPSWIDRCKHCNKTDVLTRADL